jgi:hypothetical protein
MKRGAILLVRPPCSAVVTIGGNDCDGNAMNGALDLSDHQGREGCGQALNRLPAFLCSK